jgi:2-keto-3-deoxy-L-rhamnonate aldolase RhmA
VVELRERLSSRRRIGVMMPVADDGLVEHIGHAGFDLVVLDLEHGAGADDAVERAIRAGEAARIAVLARFDLREPLRIARFLDAGGDGIVVAHVDDLAAAERLASLVTYPPAGVRGAGATRIARSGTVPTTAAWLAAEAARPLVIAQVETGESVAALDAILGVARIDGVLVGPRDLSISLGVPGAGADDPAMAAALARVSHATREAGRLRFALCRSLDAADPSADVVLVSLTTVLSAAAAQLS